MLAHHAPMSAVLDRTIASKDGVWREAFNSEGFMEVPTIPSWYLFKAANGRRISMSNARRKPARAEEKLRQKQHI